MFRKRLADAVTAYSNILLTGNLKNASSNILDIVSVLSSKILELENTIALMKKEDCGDCACKTTKTPKTPKKAKVATGKPKAPRKTKTVLIEPPVAMDLAVVEPSEDKSED